MIVETRDMGLELSARTVAPIGEIVRTALDRFEESVRRVRIRLIPLEHDRGVRCRVRVWRLAGPSIVSTSEGKSLSSSLHSAARTLARSLRREKGRGLRLRRAIGK